MVKKIMLVCLLSLPLFGDVDRLLELYDSNTNSVLEFLELQNLYLDLTGASPADSVVPVSQGLLFLDFNLSRTLEGRELEPALDFFELNWGLVLPPARTKYSDLAYGPDAKHRFDAYVPDGASAAPVVIYVHGGIWKQGDKRDAGEMPSFFTDQGYIFISLNYRLTSQTNGIQHPDHIDDVALGIEYVLAHVASYGGDPQNVVLVGFSAGAHLASLAFTHQRYTLAYGDDAFRCVVLLDGMFTNMPRHREVTDWSDNPDMLRAFGIHPLNLIDASAVHQVRNAPAGTHFAPCLFVQQGYLGLGMAHELGVELEARGSSYDRIYVPDKQHTQVRDHMGWVEDPMSWEVLAFIKGHLR